MSLKKSEELLTNVGSRTTIFQVSKALGSNVPRDTDRRTTVSNTVRESANVASLVFSGQPHFIVLAIDGDMLHMLLGQFLNGSFNGLHATWFSHLLGGIVGVASSTIPVACKGFRVERHFDTPFFGNTDEEETGHPEMITHGNSFTRADLEFPLRWHDFCINPGDIDTGIKAGAVVGFNQVSGENFSSSY